MDYHAICLFCLSFQFSSQRDITQTRRARASESNFPLTLFQVSNVLGQGVLISAFNFSSNCCMCLTIASRDLSVRSDPWIDKLQEYAGGSEQRFDLGPGGGALVHSEYGRDLQVFAFYGGGYFAHQFGVVEAPSSFRAKVSLA